MAQSEEEPPLQGRRESHEASFDIILAGAARPVPGRTKQEGAHIVMDALCRAALGRQVVRPRGQQDEWLHRRFIATDLDVGVGTWKYFKRKYADEIELDESQQWVRLRPAAP